MFDIKQVHFPKYEKVVQKVLRILNKNRYQARHILKVSDKKIWKMNEIYLLALHFQEGTNVAKYIRNGWKPTGRYKMETRNKRSF